MSRYFTPSSGRQVKCPILRVWVSFKGRRSRGRARKRAGRRSIAGRSERKRGRAGTLLLGNVVAGIGWDMDDLDSAFGE